MSDKTKEKPREELGLKVEVGRSGGGEGVVVVDRRCQLSFPSMSLSDPTSADRVNLGHVIDRCW
jgi:hypothetical protein